MQCYSLFYLETTLHVSGGTITHNQERKQLYLQHLVFVASLLLSGVGTGLSVLWVAYATHSTLKPVSAPPR
jgi:cytochrome c biogenesis protein CcdA